MATLERPRSLRPPELTAEEAEMARTAQRCIMEALDRSKAATITVESDDGSPPAIKVPPQALRLIAAVLGALSERRDVVLLPAKREFTTVEAANYLNVSRPFVIKEIDAGRLKHRMVGTHRRVEFEDLQAYARDMRANQAAALQRLADDAQDMGLEY
jgi:excisionase family DNA binding protein